MRKVIGVQPMPLEMVNLSDPKNYSQPSAGATSRF
jgi:hypothetical protein